MDDTADPRERNMNEEDIMKKKDMIFEDILKLLIAELDVSPTDIRHNVSTISDVVDLVYSLSIEPKD